MSKTTVTKDRRLRVFFSAPSLADPEKQEMIEWIRGQIMKLGADFTYDWITDKNEYGPRQLYQRVKDGIYQADMVIAELTFPSTGVGQQVGMALQRKIPVLGLIASWKDVPKRFTVGSEGEYFQVEEYTKQSLPLVLKRFFKSMGKERFVKFNFISTADLNEALEKESVKQGVSRSQLLRQIIRQWFDWHYGTYVG